MSQTTDTETIGRAEPPTQTDKHGPPELAQQTIQQRRKMQRIQERTGIALVLCAAIFLEVLPVMVWLLFIAAGSGASAAPLLPFWWLLIVVLGAWSVAATLRRAPAEGRRGAAISNALKIAIVIGWSLTAAISLLLSPAAYRGIDMTRLLPTVAADFYSGSVHVGTVIGLALFAGYLWWRGLLLGRLPLTQPRLYIRFIVGLVAIVAAIAGAASIRGQSRQTLGGILAFLLPIEAFVGLVGLSLAHLLDALDDQRRRRLRGQSEDGPSLTVTRSWIVTAFGISSGVVVVALVLALLVSYDSIQALAQALQPVGNAIMAGISWILYAFAYLLFLLLNPLIDWLHDRAQSVHPQPQPTPNPGAKPPVNPHTQPINGLPTEWLIVGRWVLLVLFITVIVMALIRVLRRFGEWNHPQEFDEERESLDGASLLRRQLRDLARRLLPHRRAASAPLEPLPTGSVRLLYREALQAAVHVGYARAPSETPDEYAARLRAEASATNGPTASIAPNSDAGEALNILTEAYDIARYGKPADKEAKEASESASSAVATAQRTVLSWLHALEARHDEAASGSASRPNQRDRQ